MDWSWITPAIAAALAGAIGAVGALIGAVATGAINLRNTKCQIEAQTRIALQQLQSQERIAEANPGDNARSPKASAPTSPILSCPETDPSRPVNAPTVADTQSL